MESFLKSLSRKLIHRYHGDYRTCLVLFPTRRACLIFRKVLGSLHNTPVHAPGVMSIADFVSAYSDAPVSEELPLLLTLYDASLSNWPGQEFTEFYPWGQMLLNDFDESDKFLSDPSKLFSGLSELRKLEASFLPAAESLEWIRGFLATVDEGNLTALRASFADNWNRLQPLYQTFNKLLSERRLSYEGRSYRMLLAKLRSGWKGPEYKHLLFAGFYGFSKVEEQLITALGRIRQTEVIWDMDAYYTANPVQEAGLYFRKSEFAKTHMGPVQSMIRNHPMHITMAGASNQAGQAKLAGDLMLQLIEAQTFDPESTALVLPDENLLFPVLYALPESIDSVNVTMGYPLRKSQFTEFIQLLRLLHLGMRKSGNDTPSFPMQTVNRLIHHPLLRPEKKPSDPGNETVQKYLTPSHIAQRYGVAWADLVFKNVPDVPGLFEYLDALFAMMAATGKDPETEIMRFEKRIAAYIRNELATLRLHLAGHTESIPLKIAWQMVVECVSGIKIPFSGEPVRGLQIMGFLETRALDFKTLFIFSANEGTLPANAGQKSFIPFSLRKAFGLETFEEQDASYAYHFYRLLHRAERVYILYNTETDALGASEKSRFILQLEQELIHKDSHDTHIARLVGSPPQVTVNAEPPRLLKSHASNAVLEKYAARYTRDDAKAFSPSALSVYIQCALRFYFRYIAGIRERNEIAEQMDAAAFGNVLHGTMELLYGALTGTSATATAIRERKPHIEAAVDQSIRKQYLTDPAELEGNDLILRSAIVELVSRLLDHDARQAPFELLGLETEVHARVATPAGQEVRLQGKIDRIEKQGDLVSILDYKTGKVETDTRDLDALFSDPKYQTVFQLLCYTWMYKSTNPSVKVRSGFYAIRELGEGQTWLHKGAEIGAELLDAFGERLSGLLGDMLNPEGIFEATRDETRCTYCEFKDICNR